MNKKFLLPGILSLIMASSVLTFSLPIWKDNVKEEDKMTDWMAGFNDTTTLASLSIPGSHDSGARYSLLDLSGRCQDLSIASQLDIGVRYLDIRLYLTDSYKFQVIHGPVNQRLSFASVVNTCIKFLDDHPSETLLISVKEEKENKKIKEAGITSFDAELKKALSDEHFITSTNMLDSALLGQTRGKAILFSRYEASTIGINCYDGWEDPSSADSPNSFTMSNNIFVQDHYKISDMDAYKEEIIAGLDHVSLSYKFNFISGYKVSSFPPSYSYSVTNEINPWIIKTVEGKTNLGVVIADSVTSEFTKAIIGGNA